MYGCEIWTIKKAECQRIDTFELWCWRRLLRVPWTARRSIQSILKEISPEYSLEGLMLKLKLQYFGHVMQELTHWKRPCCWERLKAGGEGDNRGWDGWMASPTQWTWVWVNSGSWWWTGSPGMLRFMRTQSQTWLHDWTDTVLHSGCMNFSSVQTLSRVQLFATPWTEAHQASCYHQLPEPAQTHIHWVGDAIQPSHTLLSHSPPAFNPSQQQGLFQWVSSSH